MYDRWEADAATGSQIQYIKTLMTSKEGYILRVDLDTICKGEASNLIQALLYDTHEKLINEKIIKPKYKRMTQEEFVKKFEEHYKTHLLPTEINSKVKYKVSGTLHLWGWTNFKEEVNGSIMEYDTIGNTIKSITYEIEGEIDKNILKKYGLIAEIIR
jgi:hypothetical protein